MTEVADKLKIDNQPPPPPDYGGSLLLAQSTGLRTYEAKLYGGTVTAIPLGAPGSNGQTLWEITVHTGDGRTATVNVRLTGQFGPEQLVDGSYVKNQIGAQILADRARHIPASVSEASFLNLGMDRASARIAAEFYRSMREQGHSVARSWSFVWRTYIDGYASRGPAGGHNALTTTVTNPPRSAVGSGGVQPALGQQRVVDIDPDGAGPLEATYVGLDRGQNRWQTRVVEVQQYDGRQWVTKGFEAHGVSVTDLRTNRIVSDRPGRTYRLEGRTPEEAISRAREMLVHGAISTRVPSNGRSVPGTNDGRFETQSLIVPRGLKDLGNPWLAGFREVLDAQLGADAQRYLQAGNALIGLRGTDLQNYVGVAMGLAPNVMPVRGAGNQLLYNGEALQAIGTVSDAIRAAGGQAPQVRAVPVYLRVANDKMAKTTIFRVQGRDGRERIVDNVGRTYESLQKWRENNQLGAVDVFLPQDGRLQGRDGKVVLEAFNNRRFDNTVLPVLRGGVAILGVGGGVAMMLGTGGWAAPLVMAGGTVFSVVDSGSTLGDRAEHGQTLALTDPQARAAWLDLGAGLLGAGAIGTGSRALARASDLADLLTLGNGARDLQSEWDKLGPGERLLAGAQLAFWASMLGASQFSGGRFNLDPLQARGGGGDAVVPRGDAPGLRGDGSHGNNANEGGPPWPAEQRPPVRSTTSPDQRQQPPVDPRVQIQEQVKQQVQQVFQSWELRQRLTKRVTPDEVDAIARNHPTRLLELAQDVALEMVVERTFSGSGVPQAIEQGFRGRAQAWAQQQARDNDGSTAAGWLEVLVMHPNGSGHRANLLRPLVAAHLGGGNERLQNAVEAQLRPLGESALKNLVAPGRDGQPQQATIDLLRRALVARWAEDYNLSAQDQHRLDHAIALRLQGKSRHEQRTELVNLASSNQTRIALVGQAQGRPATTTDGTNPATDSPHALNRGSEEVPRLNPRTNEISIATRNLHDIKTLPQGTRYELADFLVRSNPESYAERTAALNALDKAGQIYVLRDAEGGILGTATLTRTADFEWYLGQVAAAPRSGAGGDVMKWLLGDFKQLAKNSNHPVRIWAYTNKAENVYNVRDPSQPGFYAQLGAIISDSNPAGAVDMTTRRRIDIEWRFDANGNPVQPEPTPPQTPPVVPHDMNTPQANVLPTVSQDSPFPFPTKPNIELTFTVGAQPFQPYDPSLAATPLDKFVIGTAAVLNSRPIEGTLEGLGRNLSTLTRPVTEWVVNIPTHIWNALPESVRTQIGEILHGQPSTMMPDSAHQKLAPLTRDALRNAVVISDEAWDSLPLEVQQHLSRAAQGNVYTVEQKLRHSDMLRRAPLDLPLGIGSATEWVFVGRNGNESLVTKIAKGADRLWQMPPVQIAMGTAKVIGFLAHRGVTALMVIEAAAGGPKLHLYNPTTNQPITEPSLEALTIGYVPKTDGTIAVTLQGSLVPEASITFWASGPVMRNGIPRIDSKVIGDQTFARIISTWQANPVTLGVVKKVGDANTHWAGGITVRPWGEIGANPMVGQASTERVSEADSNGRLVPNDRGSLDVYSLVAFDPTGMFGAYNTVRLGPIAITPDRRVVGLGPGYRVIGGTSGLSVTQTPFVPVAPASAIQTNPAFNWRMRETPPVAGAVSIDGERVKAVWSVDGEKATVGLFVRTKGAFQVETQLYVDPATGWMAVVSPNAAALWVHHDIANAAKVNGQTRGGSFDAPAFDTNWRQATVDQWLQAIQTEPGQRRVASAIRELGDGNVEAGLMRLSAQVADPNVRRLIIDNTAYFKALTQNRN